MTTQVAAVLFDLGGVLVQLDGLVALANQTRGRHSPDSIHELWKSSPSVTAHETGRMAIHEFAAEVVTELELQTTPDAFIVDFAKWPRNLFPGALDLLRAIPSDLTIAALSNTNPTHLDGMTAIGLMQHFDHAFLSYEIGHMKPDEEPFHAALAGMDVAPSDVLFFDDNLPNVETAQRLGMRAYQATSPDDVRRALTANGVTLGHH